MILQNWTARSALNEVEVEAFWRTIQFKVQCGRKHKAFVRFRGEKNMNAGVTHGVESISCRKPGLPDKRRLRTSSWNLLCSTMEAIQSEQRLDHTQQSWYSKGPWREGCSGQAGDNTATNIHGILVGTERQGYILKMLQ